MISKDFINSNKLVTLNELNYLLLEALERKDPVAWHELSKTCKERSLNFAFAFENTIAFLQLIGIIKINEDQSVIRNPAENFDIKNEHELITLIVNKTFSYLESNDLLKQVVNQETITATASKDTLAIHTDKIPSQFPFVKVLLLNFKIAGATKFSNDQLIIFKEYKTLFQDRLLKVEIQTTSVKKPTFFISYAHKDEEYKEELRNHLSGLIRKDSIEEWNGRDILPGEDWEKEVRKKLEQAEVVLFLMSADFMASEYINRVEIKETIERYNKGLVRIIPVLVRPCDFTSLLIGKYQVVPTGALAVSEWPNRDAAYLDVVKHIKRILNKN